MVARNPRRREHLRLSDRYRPRSHLRSCAAGAAAERASANAATDHDFLLARVADDLAERLAIVRRDFPLAANIGAHHGLVSQGIRGHRRRRTHHRRRHHGSSCCAARPSLRVVADEEALPFADASLDLVVSGLSLQLVNDLPGALVQIRRALKPDGLLLASLLGGVNAERAARSLARGGGRDQRRRLAARRPVRRRARHGRAAAARRLCTAGGRFRDRDRHLRQSARPHAGDQGDGRQQHARRAAAHAGDAPRCCCARRRSTPSASPAPTVGCRRRSRS